MLKKLFNIIRLYILRINIYIFPDKREALSSFEADAPVDKAPASGSGAFYISGTGSLPGKDAFYPRNVLLGVFRNVAQFEICLEKSFYYIPYELVEGFEASLKYVALYQSKNLFGYDAGIRYYGNINSFEIVTRDKISEIFSENEGLYCRFEVDGWKTLDNVIYPREIGFVREFTTLFLLENSREVPQLFAESMTEFNLYNALSVAVEYRQKITFKDYCMFTRKGFLLVFKGASLTHFYPEKEFRIRPGATVKSIMKDLGL